MSKIKLLGFSFVGLLLAACLSLAAVPAAIADEIEQPTPGWNQINDNWIYINEDGSLAQGWKWIWNGWFYFDENGNMLTEWQKINDLWYYFLPDAGSSEGKMVTGWMNYDNNWYYFSVDPYDGSMYTGWKYLENAWFHFGGVDDGTMKTGWYEDENGDLCYFYENGALATNTWIGSDYVDHRGVYQYTEENHATVDVAAAQNFKYQGVIYQDGFRYTYYSSRVLYHYRTGEWWAGADGIYRDSSGYVIVASDSDAFGSLVPTPFGTGKVYDTGAGYGTRDIYVNW